MPVDVCFWPRADSDVEQRNNDVHQREQDNFRALTAGPGAAGLWVGPGWHRIQLYKERSTRNGERNFQVR